MWAGLVRGSEEFSRVIDDMVGFLALGKRHFMPERGTNPEYTYNNIGAFNLLQIQH